MELFPRPSLHCCSCSCSCSCCFWAVPSLFSFSSLLGSLWRRFKLIADPVVEIQKFALLSQRDKAQRGRVLIREEAQRSGQRLPFGGLLIFENIVSSAHNGDPSEDGVYEAWFLGFLGQPVSNHFAHILGGLLRGLCSHEFLDRSTQHIEPELAVAQYSLRLGEIGYDEDRGTGERIQRGEGSSD